VLPPPGGVEEQEGEKPEQDLRRVGDKMRGEEGLSVVALVLVWVLQFLVELIRVLRDVGWVGHGSGWVFDRGLRFG
jgi:hypothetical protein